VLIGKDGSALYYVNSIKELKNVILPYFIKYPLITQKQGDFILFKMIIELMTNKKHLTIEGLNEIVRLRASMNLGLSDELTKYFPSIVPVDRPKVELTEVKDPNWLIGFVDGEGCFHVSISESKLSKTGSIVKLRFSIAQHIRDSILIKSLVQYFACGIFSKSFSQGAISIYTVNKFSDINEKIIPFFEKYPLQGSKRLNFEDFKKVVEIMRNKGHLNQEGLEEIRKIKAGMNRGRKL
jgi:hypothetical protein